AAGSRRTTVLQPSWRATAATRWSRCSSTSRAAAVKPAWKRAHRTMCAPSTTRRGRRCHERSRRASHLAAPDWRDDPALLVLADLVVAATAGIGLLADPAGRHLGLPAELHRAERQFLCARRRHADRRRHPVGHPVPRPARLFHLVPGRDVGAQYG